MIIISFIFNLPYVILNCDPIRLFIFKLSSEKKKITLTISRALPQNQICVASVFNNVSYIREDIIRQVYVIFFEGVRW